MRITTKAVTIGWILFIIYLLIATAAVKFRGAELISVIPNGILYVGIIGAIAMLRGKGAGWWIVLVLTGLAVLSGIAAIIINFVYHAGDVSFAGGSVAIKPTVMLVVFVVMFVLLILDRPSRWRRES